MLRNSSIVTIMRWPVVSKETIRDTAYTQREVKDYFMNPKQSAVSQRRFNFLKRQRKKELMQKVASQKA